MNWRDEPSDSLEVGVMVFIAGIRGGIQRKSTKHFKHPGSLKSTHDDNVACCMWSSAKQEGMIQLFQQHSNVETCNDYEESFNQDFQDPKT